MSEDKEPIKVVVLGDRWGRQELVRASLKAAALKVEAEAGFETIQVDATPPQVESLNVDIPPTAHKQRRGKGKAKNRKDRWR